MDDLISRQAAIDEVERWLLDRDDNRSVEKMLMDLPSAEPKKGKWILNRSGAYCCNKCMEPCATYVMMKPRDRFCKMCGARMEEEDTE